MSCGCNDQSSDPGFCGPPAMTNIITTGPQGVPGKSAYQVWLDLGFEGTEQDFIDSLQGTNGINGDKGDKGDTGPQGNTGATGAMGPAGAGLPIAYFTGAVWAPPEPYTNAIIGMKDFRTLKFGQIPFTTGRYLCHLNAQIGWNGSNAGPSDFSGDAWLKVVRDSSYWTEPLHMRFGRTKQGTSGYAYGTVQGYSHSFMADLTQGWTIEIACGAAFYLIGAQLTIFNPPGYVINSPGFVDGRDQEVVT